MIDKYDSTDDVLKHRERVAYWLGWMTEAIDYRGKHHDESKLQSPEKEVFDEFTPKLKEIEFGSDEYKAALESMGEGLKHHYAHNPHHPEHYQKGIDGMALWDVLEMVVDWMAVSSTKDKPVDLDYLQKRFDISPQLRGIIANSLWAADMDCINYNVPLEYQPVFNFLSSEGDKEEEEE